ncbi:MAG: phage tail tube protein [Pigmentiphaga sp.]
MAETLASIGYGSRFEVSQDNGATWFEVAEVFDITPPSDTVDMIDATHMQSPDRTREFIPGLIDPGEASFEMNFLPGSTSDAKIREIKASLARVRCRLTFPNNATWTFSAQVSGYEPAVPNDDKMTATVTFRVTGSYVPAPAAAPVNTVLPAISGVAQDGEILTVWPGVWSGAPTFAYQWKADGTNISSATGASYTAVTGDVSKAISVAVTATNAAGSQSATSGETADVIAA